MIRYSECVLNARAQVTANHIDASSTPATLTIFDGERPAALGNITTQTALATFTLQKPCVVLIDTGVITLASIDDKMVLATGSAAWALICNGDGEPILDVSIGLTGSGADIEMSSVDLIQGGYLHIPSAQIVEE